MLAYGTPTDALDKYIRIGESIVLESLRKYMREPNEQDTPRLLEI
jgi:hypothetical protein